MTGICRYYFPSDLIIYFFNVIFEIENKLFLLILSKKSWPIFIQTYIFRRRILALIRTIIKYSLSFAGG